jgi:hypothetical protein
MDDFERQLKQAMARQDPPGTFEAKVLAAAARESGRRSLWAWMAKPVTLRWATVALVLVLLVTGVTWRRERERAAGEQARAKLELALKITTEKLRHIDREIAAVQNGD